MTLYNITSQQTLIIKAIGIILIVFHNFLYWTNIIGCNELELDPDRVYVLINFIRENPLKLSDALFSYFGHYGVQLFVFISGYGLTKKFMKQNYKLSCRSYFKYLKHRLMKVYALLLFGIMVCSIFFLDEIKYYLYSMFLLLIGIKNLSYSTVFSVIGPWWYFGLAIQLYVVFPFLYYFVDKYRKKAFWASLVISYLIIYSLWGTFEYLRIPMFGNFTGHLPEFILGIGFARIINLRLSPKILIIIIPLFILSNIYTSFFPFSFLSVTVIFISVIQPIIQRYRGSITRGLAFIGSISMFMFLINGPIRAFIINNYVREYNLNPLLFSVVNFVIVIFCSYLLSKGYDKLRNLLYLKKIRI